MRSPEAPKITIIWGSGIPCCCRPTRKGFSSRLTIGILDFGFWILDWGKGKGERGRGKGEELYLYPLPFTL
ncbi:hypothetical protein FD723_02345 [Nostoc sp. C052]|nr:hypothetical protein FD723_02345 [Nostoc sp. C052]